MEKIMVNFHSYFLQCSKILNIILSFRKRRYFILRSDIRELCYYPSAEQLTLIGSIAIDATTIVWNVSEKDGNYSYSFFFLFFFIYLYLFLDPMNRNSFVVRWHAPAGSDKPNREVLLKSDDVLTMNEWLNAISSEICRTEEVKQTDWWLELFGQVIFQSPLFLLFFFLFFFFKLFQVNTLDSKAIRETIRHRNSSLPRNFVPSHSFLASYRSVPEIEPGILFHFHILLFTPSFIYLSNYYLVQKQLLLSWKILKLINIHLNHHQLNMFHGIHQHITIQLMLMKE